MPRKTAQQHPKSELSGKYDLGRRRRVKRERGNLSNHTNQQLIAGQQRPLRYRSEDKRDKTKIHH